MLEINNVSYVYPDGTKALDQLTLTIQSGKKIAILGNNGAGKSSLFLHFNGLLQPTEGEIRFQGQPLSYKRKALKELRRQVGIVFQHPDAQLFSPTVLEDVMYGPLQLGYSKQEAEQVALAILDATGLLELKHKPPHFLSVGQKKRVAIAGVAVMNPKLLILDEPTAGLDPLYAKKMMAFVSDLQQEGQTIVLSTHDINLAYEWADEIVILYNGSLQAFGSPADLFMQKELLEACHLEQPWIIEVFSAWQAAHPDQRIPIPTTKEELLKIIQRLSNKSLK
ncbi:ATP-binding cassette domain-containing protein [Bacillus sp. REN10]|uniref:energy-coupling factor ABC transporter ATP-binding protein n=1 Tax=Bacillus sp. REN10 TaxID=2782541 RepID=UPI00193B7133|nr:ATP-binding cassette domain-containing protein [Bacillus sp. REN10]